MHVVGAFNLVLASLVAILVLEVVAHRLKLPPAAALLVGGIAMAFIPGIPRVALDPELVLVVILPPLLMEGAYFTAWFDLRRHLAGILSLAVGAVVFTTVVVGLVVHAVAPDLPLAVCFALGAIVSPPDAVAAKAVLAHLRLPRKLVVLLEGESLLNDATGLVLVRFAVAAAATGVFSVGAAAGTFAMLAAGGVVVGALFGAGTIALARRLENDSLIILVTLLASWTSYAAGEALHVSGVIATVACGVVIGWLQHETLTANVRLRASAFWQVTIFVLEALVFILIGLSLRGVLARLGGVDAAVASIGSAVVATVVAVVVSRFVWVYAIELVKAALARSLAVAEWRAATVLGWAGMRGVVTLAVALALPEDLPGRDLVLVAAFAVILVTVLVQGTTLGAVIGAVGLQPDPRRDEGHLSEAELWTRLAQVQLDAVEPLAHDAEGRVIHPRLLEQYRFRRDGAAKLVDRELLPRDAIEAHFDVVLAAVAAARREMIALHRAGRMPDGTLHLVERELDLQESAARHSRDT